MSAAIDERWPEFPEPLRALFDGIYLETILLHAKWEFYLELFGDPTRINVLEDSVPAVFALVEDSLRIDMTVSFWAANRLGDDSWQRQLIFGSADRFFVTALRPIGG